MPCDILQGWTFDELSDGMRHGHTCTEEESTQRRHQSPKVHTLAITIGVTTIGNVAGISQPKQKQRLVTAVYHAVDELGQHRGRPRGNPSTELCGGNDEISSEGSPNILSHPDARLLEVLLLDALDVLVLLRQFPDGCRLPSC